MTSKARLLGHALHPMLIVFPVGLLTTAVICDVIYLVRGDGHFAAVARTMVAFGIGFGFLAGLVGLVDWIAIPGGTRAKSIGLLHAIVNVIALVLFLVAYILRAESPPVTVVFVLEFIALGFMMLGGWFGGELVDRLGVGVDDGAHLDSPNSLSGKPASDVSNRTQRGDTVGAG